MARAAFPLAQAPTGPVLCFSGGTAVSLNTKGQVLAVSKDLHTVTSETVRTQAC